MKLGIFLPTYKRPGKLQEVATNIEHSTKSEFTLYFGCEQADRESIEASQATGHKTVTNIYDPEFGYSNTIQTIYEASDDEVFFHANDDFEFLDGWDAVPMQFLADNPGVMVLGAHDGQPTPSYSTISFIRREYIERFSGVVDMPNRVFYPYHHNYQDTEFTNTAQARGLWAKIEAPCIKHHRVGGDETYSKNDVTSSVDEKTFRSREHLWKNINKEDYMPRKPMSDEQRKAASERMKARHAAKKAAEVSTESTMGSSSTQYLEVTPKDSRPLVDETTKGAMVGRAIEYLDAAFETLITVRNENPNMIEASQAVEALKECRNRAGQVQGLLSQ